MINKTAYDYENIRFDFGGAVGEVTGITDISYSDKITSDKVRGSGREAFDETDGTYEADDGEFTMHFWQWSNIIEKMGPGFMRKKARFNGSASYAHDGEEIKTDTLQKMRIKGSGKKFSSKGALMVTVPFSCMKILHNGIDPMTGDN